METSTIDSYLSKSPFYFLENYTEIFNKLKKRPTIGYFTNRIPIEILHALNTYPIRMLSISNNRESAGASERYVQSFGCSWLQQVIDLGISGGFQSLKGIIFSTGTCDSLQNVSDIWRKIFPKQWIYNLTFPVHRTKPAQEFLQNEFENLIEAITRDFPENEFGFTLSNSVKLYNLKRSYCQKLALIVSERRLSYYEFSKLLLLGDILPIDVINEYLSQIIEKIENNLYKDNELPTSPRIAVTGGKWDNYKLWSHPEFNYIVADDLAFGSRNFNFMVPQANFLEGYTNAYIERTPEATSYDMDMRIKGLKDLIRNHKIDGVIMLTNKFCDPDTFENVPIQNELQNDEIPFIKIEASSDLSNIEQIITRTSAFIELLS